MVTYHYNTYINIHIYAQGRIPFHIPDKVPWCQLIEALDYKWRHECHSGQGLTQQAKQYLAYKVFSE